jgi:CubicO group peptidase (beta-lactamase class C family)
MNHLLSIKRFTAISMTIMLALVVVLSTSGSAMAQEDRGSQGKNVASAQQQGPTDPAELEAFLDKELGREMEKHHIAGAAVSVVKDGELFLAKGYGDADIENKIPVGPEQTIFHVGSSKRESWT